VSTIAAGSDGNIWYADGGRRKIGRVTPSGGAITEFGLPDTDGSPFGIAAGPDHNVWATLTAAGQGHPDWIARITPAGEVTKFQAGSQPAGAYFGTSPQGITAGPDGNLWFTEAGAARIGRMTPSGALVEYPLYAPNGTPNAITAGPDGNVWFVMSGRSSAIAKITPAGRITAYPVGAGDEFSLGGIVSGPDGNLWFTQSTTSGVQLQGAIGRITPGGTITRFALPAGSRAYGVATGPDKNIWFTDMGGHAIGRISTSGAIRQFTLPRRNAQPAGIVTGPDGRMWFAEGSWIASIGVMVPETKLSSQLLRFGTGVPSIRTVDVTNTGEANLNISGVSIVGSDRDAFAVTNDGCTGRAVAVKTSCRVEVSFTAGSDLGLRAARLAITDNGTGSPHAVSLVAQLPDCSLPLFATPANSATSQGEFLSVRDGAVVDDPSGRYVTVSSTRLSESQASPTLVGHGPTTYVRAAKRWVPSSDHGISPDGLRYAYIEYPQPFEGKLHVVDIATGRDRTLPLEKGPWGLLAFTGDAIYLHQSYEGIGPGAMVVNPESGAVLRTILRDTTVHLISGQVAWTAWRNPADTMPEPPGIGGGSNEVQSRDLTTSQKTVWLYRPGSSLYVVAGAKGSIVVSVWDGVSYFLTVVTAPGQAFPITLPESAEPLSPGGSAAGDAYGWWFGTIDGLYLWTPHTGAFLVSESTAAPAGTCA
jgi:streptogramin lyase